MWFPVLFTESEIQSQQLCISSWVSFFFFFYLSGFSWLIKWCCRSNLNGIEQEASQELVFVLSSNAIGCWSDRVGEQSNPQSVHSDWTQEGGSRQMSNSRISFTLNHRFTLLTGSHAPPHPTPTPALQTAMFEWQVVVRWCFINTN